MFNIKYNLKIDMNLNKHLPDCDYVHLGHRTVVAVTGINNNRFFFYNTQRNKYQKKKLHRIK